MHLDNINLMEYWSNSADRDYDTMKIMFENKRNTEEVYTWLKDLLIEK